MGAQGNKINIATGPLGFKGSSEFDVVYPQHTEIRNVNLVKGFIRRRPGKRLKWDLGEKQGIALLIKTGPGYAVLNNGNIYSLTPSPKLLSEKMKGKNASDLYRPQNLSLESDILLADGGVMKNINRVTNDSEVLEGNPPNAQFVGNSHSYVILSGYENNLFKKTEMSFSSTNNPKLYGTGNGNAGVRNINFDADEIISQVCYNDKIYLFKENNFEVWALSSGTLLFTRQYTRNPGIGAKHSPVAGANDTIYFFGSDHNFYALVGDSAKAISFDFYEFFQEKIKFPEMMYGLHFEEEGVIRWFLPKEGYTFTYNYIYKAWSMDNAWSNNVGFTRLPVGAVMRFNGNTYIGDSKPTGKIYEWTRDVYTDDGDIIPVYRKYNILLNQGAGPAKVNEISFLIKRGVGVSASTDHMVVKTKFDRLGKFKEEKIDLGTVGDNAPEVRISRLGSGSFLELIIQMNNNCEYMLNAMTVIAQPRR